MKKQGYRVNNQRVADDYNPGVGTNEVIVPNERGSKPDTEGQSSDEAESTYVDQRLRSRLAARVIPALSNQPGFIGPGFTDPLQSDTVDSGGIAAGLAFGVGMDQGQRQAHRLGRRVSPTTRVYRELGPVPAALNATDGLAYIYLGMCSTDRIWELRNLLVFFTDPWTAGNAGALAALMGGTFAPGGGLHMTDPMSPGVAIPSNLYFSGDQELIFGGQAMYVVIHTPGANAQNYFASATVREYNADAYHYLNDND